jgi:hypothetical protein
MARADPFVIWGGTEAAIHPRPGSDHLAGRALVTSCYQFFGLVASIGLFLPSTDDEHRRHLSYCSNSMHFGAWNTGTYAKWWTYQQYGSKLGKGMKGEF